MRFRRKERGTRVKDREKSGAALVSFLARSKPKVSFLGISLLRNQTETLATQATRGRKLRGKYVDFNLTCSESSLGSAVVVSWCCGWAQSPNDVIPQTEKTLKNTHTTTQKRTNNSHRKPGNTRQSRQLRSLPILGDPGAVSRVDKMFVVKAYCKIETSPWALTLTVPVPEAFELPASDWPENFFSGQSAKRSCRVTLVFSYTT